MSKQFVTRACAYCGMKDGCRCEYRYRRMGGGAMKMHSTTREGTVAEFREEFEDKTKGMKQDAKVAWMFSVTKLDEAKIAKADAKRALARGDSQ